MRGQRRDRSHPGLVEYEAKLWEELGYLVRLDLQMDAQDGSMWLHWHVDSHNGKAPLFTKAELAAGSYCGNVYHRIQRAVAPPSDGKTIDQPAVRP